THVLSILDPARPEPELPAAWPPHERLTVRFNDEIDPRDGSLLPTRGQIALILGFGRYVSAAGGALLVHCQSGISRSTAAAVMIWAQEDPARDEGELFANLRHVRPGAWPNSLMLQFADELLGRDGRLVCAAQTHFRDCLMVDPALEERMRRLRR